MPKVQTAAPTLAPETVTWIPTRADTVEVDPDGNVIAVNGKPVREAQMPRVQSADPGDA